MAWTDIEAFRRIPQYMEKKRDSKASEIAKNWLNKKYFFGLDSPANKDGQQLVCAFGNSQLFLFNKETKITKYKYKYKATTITKLQT